MLQSVTFVKGFIVIILNCKTFMEITRTKSLTSNLDQELPLSLHLLKFQCVTCYKLYDIVQMD